MRRVWILLSVACGLAVPARATAQLTSGSTAALGLGDNFTAAARGHTAVAWNPASLGLADGPSASFAVLAVRGGSGLGPVTLTDLAAQADRVVPDAVRQDWLARIAGDGAQRGEGEVESTWAAVQIGRIAVHAGTRVRALADLSPGVAELIMFGNAGADGAARELDLSGSSVAARAYSSVGASLALPYDVEAGRIALGATVTYTVGHMFAAGENSTGRSSATPIAVRLDFPLVQSRLDGFRMNGGSGVGLDLGATWQSGRTTFAVVVRNVANSFAWDVAALEYRPLSLDLSESDARSRTEAEPLTAAPADVRARIEAIGFEPSWAFGAAWRADQRLLLTADLRTARDDGMFARPTKHAGAGAELHVLPWLPLRAGIARVTHGDVDAGWQAAGGLGLRVGPWGVDAAFARRTSPRLGGTTVMMLTATSVGAF